MAVIRTSDRMRSAGLRAASGDPSAELRAGQVMLGSVPVDIASPFLTLARPALGGTVVEPGRAQRAADMAVQRGLGDVLGLLIRHSDLAVHRALRPSDPLQRVVFDLLEQLRCQALAPDLPGMRANLEAVSEAWCKQAIADGVAESGVGVLVFTLTHMARARLRLGLSSEEVDSIIEGPRARLARLLGHALKRLPDVMDDQLAYAEAAIEIGRLLQEMASDSGLADEAADAARYRMLVPAQWFDDADFTPADAGDVALAVLGTAEAEREPLEGLGGYTVYDRSHDVVRRGDELYRSDRLRQLRAQLDDLVRAQAVSPARVAERLRRLLGQPVVDDWRFGTDEGVIDGRRLAQLIAGQHNQEIFQRRVAVTRVDTAVTILMDNSGSMKMQRYEVMATLVDTLTRALDNAGVATEVLGHTTASWSGGAPIVDWRSAGKPANPGRLCEVSHIIYKDADTSWRNARHSLAAMLRPDHFAEGVDGEAIVWAHNRLLARSESRKLLLVLSDGAPAESGTQMGNGPNYLGDHLARVVSQIERRSVVEIAALTVDSDVSSVFASSLPIDLDATLTIGSYGVFEALFN